MRRVDPPKLDRVRRDETWHPGWLQAWWRDGGGWLAYVRYSVGLGRQAPRVGGRRSCSASLDLRHLHATTLLLAGVPVHVVANRLGHADAAITLRAYAHVLRQDTAEVGDVFGNAVHRVSKVLANQPSRPVGVLGRKSLTCGFGGAACRNRTDDLLITSETLCRLS
jgi:Phage integrase family